MDEREIEQGYADFHRKLNRVLRSRDVKTFKAHIASHPGQARRLSENGYFSQSLRQAQIIILEILQCIPVVIIFAFLDLEKNISFSDSLL